MRKRHPRRRRRKKIIRREWPAVRRVTIHHNERFLVDGRPLRERKFFRTESDALVQADVWARERVNQGIEALAFPTELRIEVMKAAQRLAPYGRKIADAVDHYVRWLEEQKQKESALSVNACVDEWIKSKEDEADEAKAHHLAPTTIQELRSKSKLIRAAFGDQKITEIDEPAVQTFIDSLPHAPRGKLNIRVKLSQFLNYCRRKKWISENPAAGCKKIRVPASEIQILRPKQAEALLTAAQESKSQASVIPYLAVSLFGGLRPGEAAQLRWEFIHFDTNEIEVLAKTSKTRETRFVKMEDALVAWLSPYSRKNGPIIAPNFLKDWKSVRTNAGYAVSGTNGRAWPKDVLRHTFGTYWLARHEDRARLAEQMGNTIEVIKKHYRRAVPKIETEKFWTLRPKGRGKIAPISVTA